MAFILVADDHSLNRHFLATLLSYYGHRVREASDGEEALALIRDQAPDVIIADVVMPRVDGPALVKALRADPALASIPVVFYSATYRELEARAIGRASGVEHVIAKPADPDVILDTVHRALGRGAPVRSETTRGSVDRSREYISRLQLASIRMSALIELSIELSNERDAGTLLHTACRAVRKIFGADYAVIAIDGTRAADGEVAEARLDELIERIDPLATSARRAADASDPLIVAAHVALTGAASAMLVPTRERSGLHGWLLLASRTEAHPFTEDDERLAVAAANQIRAEHESVRLAAAERQRVEAELRTSRENVAALVEAAPVAIIAYDRDLTVLSWNAAAERMFGWRAQEVIGRPTPIVPAGQAEQVEALIARCLDGATLTGIEQQRVRKDGSRIDVTVALAPLHDGAGAVRGLVSILDDVTDMRASREAERARIARDLHDNLGQLLTAIKFDVARLLQDLERGAPPPARVTSELLPLIDTTLGTVSRIVSQLRASGVDERGLVAAIAATLKAFEQRTGISAALNVQPEDLKIGGDLAAALFPIVEEALTNVARHAKATRVDIRLRSAGDEVSLQIHDDGRGIRDAERLAGDAHGLIGMRERVRGLGGTIEITGSEQHGTTIAVRAPRGAHSGADR